MKSIRHLRRSRTGTWLVATVSLLAIGSAFAQRDRITHVLDNYQTVVVRGHLNPMAKAQFDHGAAPGDFVLRGMTMAVRRTAAQQKDLDQLLAAQQNPHSPQYHKWLTPEQFADRFGASQSDLTKMRQWLESKGFQIKAVARSRTFIRFDATAAQVNSGFATEIHQYAVNGAKHYANVREPSLPANLAPLVLAVGGMDDFGPQPSHVRVPALTTKVKAHYYDSNSNTDLAPGDLAAIYDIGQLQTAPNVNYGSGQTVVVIGTSDVTAADLTTYCSTFTLGSGCGSNFTQTFPANDSDPGVASGDNLQFLMQATMDLELVSAVAPNAALVLDADANVWNALYDAIDNQLGQVIVMSFGQCETAGDPSLPGTIQSSVQAANALGITVIAASGDSGAAGCDVPPVISATGGLAVTLPAAIPEVTGVGGTEFTDVSGAGTTNGPTGGTISGYISEIAWNDVQATEDGDSIVATGGGVSTVFTTTPTWQSPITGVVSAGRNVPDVALSASFRVAPYVGVVTMGGSQMTGPSGAGTEASSAVFAGIVALMNASQAGGASTGSGNINPALYAIAAGSNGYSGDTPAFHTITSGANMVACAAGPNCPESGYLGYAFATPYDQSTGLGSIDAYNLNQAVTARNTAPAISSLSVSTATAGHGDLSVTITGTGFASDSTVAWTVGSTPTTLSSTYSSATSMSATVPSALLATAGSAQITVVSAINISSNSETFTIAAPPVISSLSPSTATAGVTSPVALTVNGTGFASGYQVYWGSQSLASSCTSTACSVTVSTSLLAAAGSADVKVVSTDGVSSATSPFTINDPPAIASITGTATAGNANPVVLTLNGTGLTNTATVAWKFWGATSSLSWSSCAVATATSCSVTVPSSLLTKAGNATITVTSFDHIASNAQSFTVAATPVITSLSQATATAGHPALLVTLTGTGFASGYAVKWNAGSTPLVSTYISATSMSATILVADLATAGSANLTVVTPDGVSSANFPFTINAAPVVTTLTPATATVGNTNPVSVTIAGSNFTTTSIVKLGTLQLTSWYGSSTSLLATVPASSLLTAGTPQITVVSSDGVASTGSTFTVAAAPIITSLTPASATTGSANPVTVAIAGSGFTAGSVVTWKGRNTPLTGTCPSVTSCSATIPASYLATAATAVISVRTADGVSSAGSNFVIATPPTISSLSVSTIAAGSPTQTVVISGSGYASTSVVKWNGSTTLTSTYSTSAHTLTATVPAGNLLTAGSNNISVITSDGVSSVASANSTFTVTPVIAGLTPSAVSMGASQFTLAIAGNGFTTASSVIWKGRNTPIAGSSCADSTHCTAVVPASSLVTAGLAGVTVKTADGVSSNSMNFSIASAIITSFSPNSASVGSSAFALAVNGTGFSQGASIWWYSQAAAAYVQLQPTVFVSTTQLTGSVPANQIPASAGSVPVMVINQDGTKSVPSNFTIVAAGVPTITSLTPSVVTAGVATDTQVVVKGTGFTAGTKSGSGSSTVFTHGSTVLVNGSSTGVTYTALGTTTTITVTLSHTALLASAGTLQLTVVNASGTSSATPFTLNGPKITAVTPSIVAAGGTTAPTVVVTGINFIAGTKATVGSTTTYTPGTHVYFTSSTTTTEANYTALGTVTGITTTVPVSLLSSTGTLSMTVQNSSGAVSAPYIVSVGAPTITAMSATSALAGSAIFNLTLTGTNFVSNSKVWWGTENAALVTTYVSATSIKAAVTATELATAGPQAITVMNGSIASSPSNFTVNGPTIVSMNPASAVTGSLTGSNTQTITVTGANFVSKASQIMWDGVALGTQKFISATQVSAVIPATDEASQGVHYVTVQNASNAISSALPFGVGVTIEAMSAYSANAGSAAFNLTLVGSNFVSGSTVMWGSTALTTTYGSATQLTAAVTAAQLATTGAQSITVKNSSTLSSAGINFTVNGPTLATISSNTAVAGSAGFTLTVTGTHFVNNAGTAPSTVMWGVTPLTTTYVNATQLTAAVTAAQLAAAATPSITVQNGSSAVSTGSTFTVSGPTIGSLSSTTIAAGSTGFTLTVTGTNFVSGAGTSPSTVMWGTTPLTTTPVSATQVTAAVLTSQLLTVGTQSITVQNGVSAPTPSGITFTITGATIGSLSPSSITANTGLTLTVNGTGFVTGSTVKWGAISLATTYVSATQVTAVVPSADTAAPGPVVITVVLPTGVISTPSTFSVGPTIGSLSPNTAFAGSAAFTLTVNGTYFVSGSVVKWGSTALTTTYVSATQLTAAVTAGLVASAGPQLVTVQNAGATSQASTFTVGGPTVSSLSSSAAVAGSAAFTLTVNGTNFVSGAGTSPSTVMWGSTALVTTPVSATQVTAAVTAALLASAGTPSITVQNGSAVSTGTTFTVSGPTIATLSANSAVAGDTGYTLTVTGTNFISGAGTSPSTVMWGTTALTTTYVSATQLTAAVLTAQLATAGPVSVTVENGASAVSSASTFTITAAPTLTLLSKTSATHGGAAFTLTVTGTYFATGAVVNFGTTALTTTFVSATSVTAAVPKTAIATHGSANVTVVLPGGATTALSSASTFTIN
jgi:hypothetical protein